MPPKILLAPILAFGALQSCAPQVGSAAGAPPPQVSSKPSGESPRPATGTTANRQVASSPAQASPIPAASNPSSPQEEGRPSVLVEGMDFVGVRTRLIPRVMGKGWMLSVNKGDSIEFLRPADPSMTQALFGTLPPSGGRIRLRFRLSSEADGIRISAASHLLGAAGATPDEASREILLQSLDELRQDLLTAPVSTEPKIDRVKPRKK